MVLPSTTEGNLPPPTEFMLHPTTAPIETVATSFGLFMDEILDGYHSGDNVDDDIDDVDYTIRIPSFHGQICKYTSSKK